MNEMQTNDTDVHGVILSSRGSSLLHCAKMAEQIKVNTIGGSWNIVLDVGPDPPTERKRGPAFKFWDPSYLWNSWS